MRPSRRVVGDQRGPQLAILALGRRFLSMPKGRQATRASQHRQRQRQSVLQLGKEGHRMLPPASLLASTDRRIASHHIALDVRFLRSHFRRDVGPRKPSLIPGLEKPCVEQHVRRFSQYSPEVDARSSTPSCEQPKKQLLNWQQLKCFQKATCFRGHPNYPTGFQYRPIQR